MLKKEIESIIYDAKETGWVVEPEAKRLLALTGIKVPNFGWAQTEAQALQFAADIKFPLAVKIVSSQVLHKSDKKGVLLNVNSKEKLKEAFRNFSKFDGFAGILVEEMVGGTELIIGAKIDYQFGPVILLGIGGTSVEIYKDTALRMAPLNEKDVVSMINCLRGREIINGYRGVDPVNLADLIGLMLTFSEIVMSIEQKIESIDLNPVICSSKLCVVADARIILKTS